MVTNTEGLIEMFIPFCFFRVCRFVSVYAEMFTHSHMGGEGPLVRAHVLLAVGTQFNPWLMCQETVFSA